MKIIIVNITSVESHQCQWHYLCPRLGCSYFTLSIIVNLFTRFGGTCKYMRKYSYLLWVSWLCLHECSGQFSMHVEITQCILPPSIAQAVNHLSVSWPNMPVSPTWTQRGSLGSYLEPTSLRIHLFGISTQWELCSSPEFLVINVRAIFETTPDSDTKTLLSLLLLR